MAKKKPELADKSIAGKTSSRGSPVFLGFLEKHAVAMAFIAVIFASARIISTYTIFNHTFDEPDHIACGMEWLDQGVYTWEPHHPPLARVATATGPYLLGFRSPHRGHSAGTALEEGLKILYAGHHYDLTLAMARLGILPFFWIACFVVYEWGRRYFNPAVAVLAVASFTFVPPVLAHAGLATTDMALTAFLGATFLALMMWVERPDAKRAALFGACGGLAILSKFSALAFFPAVAGAAFLWYVVTARPPLRLLLQEVRQRLTTLPVAALACCLVIWAGYRFSIGHVPFLHNLVLPAPQLFAGIGEVEQHNQRGHYTYLLGQRGMRGWWYFFPVVLAVKTPLALLILAGIWVVLATRDRASFSQGWIALAFSAGILGVAMLSNINIGLRHILPVYIGLSLLAATVAHWTLQRTREYRLMAIAVALLAAWFAGSSLLSHPDYLPYFNELAGDHPENIVVDSDLDWGQDIKRLSKRLKEVGAQELALSTLLLANFETEHGLPHLVDQMDVLQPPTGWTAVGFSYWKMMRLGLFDKYPQYQLWPDRFPPTERVGKSMALWYFPPGSPAR